MFTLTHPPQNWQPQDPTPGSPVFLQVPGIAPQCRVRRKSQRSSSATSIVMLVHKGLSWRRRYKLVQKPDFCRPLISGPPIRFAGACHPPALPSSHPNTAFCSTGGVVAHLEEFYPGNTVSERNTSKPLFLITASV